MTPQVTPATRLRLAREAAGLEQTELAERIGVARNTVSRYELGLSDPKLGIAARWAAATGVSLDWIATGTEYGEAA